MVRLQEHQELIQEVKKAIMNSKPGYHRKDLIRHYNKLQREYALAIHYMKGLGERK